MVTKIVSHATRQPTKAHRFTGHVRLAQFLNFVNILSNHLALT
jgi:hypothetical protein